MLTIVKNENSNTISIPADEMEKLGINDGDEVEISKENDEIVLRSTKEAERKRKFEKAKNEVFKRWNKVFIELAKGVDDKTIQSNSGGKFVLSKSNKGLYKFILREADGKITYESPAYNSRQEARKAIESLKNFLLEVELETI